MDNTKALEKHLRNRLAQIDHVENTLRDEPSMGHGEELRQLAGRKNEVLTALLILLNGPDWSA